MDSRLFWALLGLAAARPNASSLRGGLAETGDEILALHLPLQIGAPRASQTPGTANSALASQMAGDQGGLDVLGLALHFICEPGNACYPTAVAR